ncbi:hypothetical protein [Streptomyces tendae]|uniref:Uncharacterized protein n=1 Tax=Streptomyces tendae TaxID=1932 RepID=A0ABX5ZW83_STRTE|nr:hypothetical protein [Streptomyces tendae]QER88605.1 hypothetical protein F3L20_24580 [Streptomyces tendae]
MPSKLGKQMSDLIRGQQPKPSTGQSKADEIRGYYKQGLQQIRGQRNMHPERRRVEVAQLYATTQAALKKVQREQIEADRETFAKLERQLWGFDDVRASAIGSADRAAVDGTVRDAQDRAAKLKKPGEAARALDAAEQAGDKVLARAIAKRAHDMDWDDVVTGYLSTRPTDAERYQQAGEIYTRQNTTGGALTHGFLGALGTPEELRGLSGKDIAAMAEPQDSAA